MLGEDRVSLVGLMAFLGTQVLALGLFFIGSSC